MYMLKILNLECREYSGICVVVKTLHLNIFKLKYKYNIKEICSSPYVDGATI